MNNLIRIFKRSKFSGSEGVFSPSFFSLLKFLLLGLFRYKSTYIYSLSIFTLWLLNSLFVGLFIEDEGVFGNSDLISRLLGSWNGYFYNVSIVISAFFAMFFGFGWAAVLFGANNGLDLIVCSKPFSRESVILAKILALLAVSVFIALITLFSSLSAFLTDSSKTTSKTYFFFEVFLSSFLSSLFFGALAAVFNSHFKARGSSLFVLGIRIFFGSLLGASSTLMMTFFTSYSLKPVVEQKKEIFANTKRGDFSLVKKPVSIYKDDFFYLTTLRSDQERNSSKHEPKQGLPEFGFNKAQIDILTKIVNTSKSSTILPRILHIINIPYQLSSIGSYINDKNVNTTFFPPDSPILFSPESSFSFKVLEAGEGDNKDLWPLTFKYKDKSYFALPTPLSMSGGNTILNDEIAVDLNSSTNKYLRYRVENIFYTIIDSNNKVDRLISYHEGINTPVRLILNSSNKKGVKKEKIVGAVDLSTGIIPLLSSLFFTDVIVKGFVNDKGVNVRVKTASDLNVNLLNYLHSNIDRKLTIKSTLELLAAAYIAIYLGDYPQGLRQLVLEAVNQPVNINGKSYIVGLPIDPNGRRGDSLFMPVNNILHYSVDYNTISLAIYLTMWITTILVLFTIIFFIYRKKDYK